MSERSWFERHNYALGTTVWAGARRNIGTITRVTKTQAEVTHTDGSKARITLRDGVQVGTSSKWSGGTYYYSDTMEEIEETLAKIESKAAAKRAEQDAAMAERARKVAAVLEQIVPKMKYVNFDSRSTIGFTLSYDNVRENGRTYEIVGMASFDSITENGWDRSKEQEMKLVLHYLDERNEFRDLNKCVTINLTKGETWMGELANNLYTWLW